MAGIAPPAITSAPAPWPGLQRILFRFVFCYLALYAIPIKPWSALIPWIAIHIFHLSGQATTYFVTGSGDTTLAYIENLFFAVTAAFATIVWTLIDRKRPDYRVLHSWLRLFIRYTLAGVMFSYGFAKIVPIQFQPPRLDALIEPYGDFSPMGVLWRFMGVSAAYTVFAGAAETAGGALLLFRRTTALGALVCFAVLANVVALNFCYDVPVKLYSSNLLLMSLFLLAPDLPRLFKLFVLNRPVPPVDLSAPAFQRRPLQVAAIALKCLVIGALLVGHTISGWQTYQQIYVYRQRPPLYGLYDVEQFTRNGRDAPPLATDADRWKKVIFDNFSTASFRMMDDSSTHFGAIYGPARNSVTLSPGGYQFTYSRPDPDHVLLEGSAGSDRLSVRLRRVDTSKFRLLSRGFHWINEYPFNR
jgi:hypothetical protein